MVPQKTWVSENFGPISKTLEVFLMGFEVSFSSDFCLGVSNFFADRSRSIRFFHFFFPFGLQESKFGRVHGSELQ